MAQPIAQDAYDILLAMLREWGLESLDPDVLRLLEEGRSQDQISLLLQDTEAYKRRFAGNEQRRRLAYPCSHPGSTWKLRPRTGR